MDCVIGFTGKNFTLIGADQNAGRSIMVFQQDLDKIMHLDSHKLLGVAGDPADTVFEPQYLRKNVELYRLRTASSCPRTRPPTTSAGRRRPTSEKP